jgi:hypothetical protein
MRTGQDACAEVLHLVVDDECFTAREIERVHEVRRKPIRQLHFDGHTAVPEGERNEGHAFRDKPRSCVRIMVPQPTVVHMRSSRVNDPFVSMVITTCGALESDFDSAESIFDSASVVFSSVLRSTQISRSASWSATSSDICNNCNAWFNAAGCVFNTNTS